MLSIFLQWEQEGSRSDAVAFCRKGRSGLTSSGTDCGTEQGQGEQLQGIGAEGRRRRGRLRERGQSTFQPLWGRVRSLVLCVCEHWDTPPASSAQPQTAQGTAGTCNYGNKERGSHPGRLGLPGPLQLQPLRSQRQLPGARHRRQGDVPGARCQLPK